MLLVTNNLATLSVILNNPIIKDSKNQHVLYTKEKKMYKEYGGKKFYGYSARGIPEKSFGMVFVDNQILIASLMGKVILDCAYQGVLINYVEIFSIKQFFDAQSTHKIAYDKEIKIKEDNEKIFENYKRDREAWRDKKVEMMDKYNADLELWKEERKAITKENKAAKEEWETALKSAPDHLKKFIVEPVYKDLPVEPNKPELPEKPEEPVYLKTVESNLRYGQLSMLPGWYVYLRNFRIVKIEGTNFGLFIRRDKPLVPTKENLYSLEIEIKDADFLANFIRTYDVKLKAEDRCIQVIDSPEAIELIAEEDDSLLELQFTEEQDKVKYYPPLAPIKPQLAASMLAGGMGGYAHEVLIDGDRYSIKAASIKEVTTRELIINGKEVKESVEHIIEKTGFYNLENFDFVL